MDNWTDDSFRRLDDLTGILPPSEIADEAELTRLDARDTVYSILWATYSDVCYA